MIAVLLEPTASIARHDDHRTDANTIRWLNVATYPTQHRADETCICLRSGSNWHELPGTTMRQAGRNWPYFPSWRRGEGIAYSFQDLEAVRR